MLIIDRGEAKKLAGSRGWLLVYGRRKTGKTFLVRRAVKWDVYFTVRRDGVIIGEGTTLKRVENFSILLDVVKGLLQENKTVVVDEFQRLPDAFLDEVATVHPSGRLVLVGSSMRVIDRVVGRRSPLLGLTAEERIDLANPFDTLVSIASRLPADEALELAPYMRDPWTIMYLQDSTSIKKLHNALRNARAAIPALVGEVFSEDERQLTRVYESVLRAVGAGQWRTREIASRLYSSRVIDSADLSKIMPYLRNMAEMNLIDAVPIYGQKERYHRLKSPIMETFYHLVDRYGFDEAEVSHGEASPTIEKLRNLHIQDFIAQFFAELRGGRRAYYFTPTKELDFIITVRGRPSLVGEVKWGKDVGRDLAKFAEAAATFRGLERIFVCREKLGYQGVTVLTPEELVELAKSKQ